jgi:hypothetical protein
MVLPAFDTFVRQAKVALVVEEASKWRRVPGFVEERLGQMWRHPLFIPDVTSSGKRHGAHGLNRLSTPRLEGYCSLLPVVIPARPGILNTDTPRRHRGHVGHLTKI